VKPLILHDEPSRSDSTVVCISVDKQLAEALIRALRRSNLLNSEYLVTRSNGKVLIPVTTPDIPGSIIGDVAYELVECSPPRKKRRPSVTAPSYDLVGDVAIVRENALEFMGLDEVIKGLTSIHPNLRAIYVKEETIDKYRVPVLRLVWGEPVEEAVVREYGLSFKVALGRVYYNPRLSEEHHRVASMVRAGEIVVDFFTGIGGFPIHIATATTSLVIANDLNEEAYRLLCENISLNLRKLRGVVIPFNLDARELPGYVNLKDRADRVIANLPKWSLEFTSVYDEVLKPGGTLHLYILTNDLESSVSDVQSRLVGWSITGFKLVLEYAPRTGIYRLDLLKPNNV